MCIDLRQILHPLDGRALDPEDLEERAAGSRGKREHTREHGEQDGEGDGEWPPAPVPRDGARSRGSKRASPGGDLPAWLPEAKLELGHVVSHLSRSRSSARDVRDLTVPRRPTVLAGLLLTQFEQVAARQDQPSSSLSRSSAASSSARSSAARPSPRETEPRPPRESRAARRARPRGGPLRGAGCAPRSRRSRAARAERGTTTEAGSARHALVSPIWAASRRRRRCG